MHFTSATPTSTDTAHLTSLVGNFLRLYIIYLFALAQNGDRASWELITGDVRTRYGARRTPTYLQRHSRCDRLRVGFHSIVHVLAVALT